MKKILQVVLLIIPGFTLGIILTIVLNRPVKQSGIMSPLGPQMTRQVLSESTSKKQTIGFLPFWNLKDVENLRYDDLSLIYYFGIPAKADGTFDKYDPGWSKMKSDEFKILQKKSKRLGITLLSMEQKQISGLVSSPSRRRALLKNTIEMMKEYNFKDINIDLEFVGDPGNNLRDNFTTMVKEYVYEIHKQIPGSTVSVATYADSAAKPRIYDIPALADIADFIVVMTYDFYRLSSDVAGPVAPLFGKEKHGYDVFTSMSDYLKVSESQKIVLGIPFYGYEWPVVNSQPNAFVLGYSSFGPAISSYKRTIETAKNNNSTINFDDISKSPWMSYFDKDSKTWRQVWFENERSMGLKLDMVNQLNLSGIAIWALGYDGPAANPLWEVIREKFSY